MKNTRWIYSGLAALILYACTACETAQPPDYTLKVGETFQVALSSNNSTGFFWSWESYRAVSKLDTLPKVYLPDSPGLVGSGGKEIWTFRAKAPGEETIVLKYARRSETSAYDETKNIRVKIVP